jgi:general secretion pathway protein G
MQSNQTLKHPIRCRNASAFTLVEMLLVLVILGVLAAIVYPKINGIGDDARQKATRAQIAALRTAFATFEVDHGYYPRGQNGIQQLAEQAQDIPNSHAPYLETIPLDGWDHEFIYECPGKHNTSSYDLMSPGPDGNPGTDDDITNWQPGR